MLLVVVTFDSNDRNSGFFEKVKTGNCVVHCLRRNISFMKKVPAHDHEIHVLADRVLLQYVDPGIKKIAWTFRQLVTSTAQMNVGDMKKLHVKNFNTRLVTIDPRSKATARASTLFQAPTSLNVWLSSLTPTSEK